MQCKIICAQSFQFRIHGVTQTLLKVLNRVINVHFILITGFSKSEDTASAEFDFWVIGTESPVGDDERSVVECPGVSGIFLLFKSI